MCGVSAPSGTADFQVCRIAGFLTCPAQVNPPIWKSAIQQVWKPATHHVSQTSKSAVSQVFNLLGASNPADLEISDTAGLETCDTNQTAIRKSSSSLHFQQASRHLRAHRFPFRTAPFPNFPQPKHIRAIGRDTLLTIARISLSPFQLWADRFQYIRVSPVVAFDQRPDGDDRGVDTFIL